jgi:hypothetical protein
MATPRRKATRLATLPGREAEAGGSAITNGVALPVTCYPRRTTKEILVKFTKQADQTLSAFLIIAALEKAARMQSLATGVKCVAQDLIPEEDYAELLRKRGGKK